MNVYHDLNELPVFHNAVITIGSFDGVHTGHQKILGRVKQLATEVEGESIVIVFHPHPRHVLRPDDDSLKLINSVSEKAALLDRYGIDNLVVVPFSVEFSHQSPDDYILNFLVKRFQPKCIVIGYDHRFGKDRAGNIEFLRKYEASAGFKLIEIEKQEVQDIAVSSTKVRKALDEGKVQIAKQLLNHSFTLNGTVVHGQGIGKKMGYPTANINVGDKHKLIPGEGIYAVYVHHHADRYEGMLYIGKRPTLEEWNNQTIEVNILDFDKDIYGDKLTLEFLKKIRGDKKFDSMEELTAQIDLDKQSALQIFESLEEKPVEEKKTFVEKPSVAVVILNYNGKEFLKDFLPSVVQSTYQNMTTHVIDNKSTDDSLAFLKKNYKDIFIYELEENYGFAGGYNEGLKRIVGFDYIVLLNSDVEVDKAWIDPIIELMESDNTIAACQPKVLQYANKNQFEHAGASGGWIDHLGYPFCRGRLFDTVELDKGQYDEAEEVFWASGAAMFIRSELFHQIGGFDASFFAHLEEIDLCWRLKRAGYKIMIEPKSVVYHVGGGTLGYENPRKVFLNFRNNLAMLLKNESGSKLSWLIPYRLILDGVAGIMFLVKGKWRNTKAIIQAHFAFYGNYAAIKKRKRDYDKLIDKVSISPIPNTKGIFQKSIVWQYYLRGRKLFSTLKF